MMRCAKPPQAAGAFPQRLAAPPTETHWIDPPARHRHRFSTRRLQLQQRCRLEAAALAGAAGGEPGRDPALPPLAAWPVTARVALRTGLYITALGLAIFFMPASVFGAVFDLRWAESGEETPLFCLPLLHAPHPIPPPAAAPTCRPRPLRPLIRPRLRPLSARRQVAAGWVRVGGVLAALFGSYYVGAALDDAAGRAPRYFYRSTIAGRLLLSAAFAALVALRQCEPGLLWLAAANAASSLLLVRAMRQRRRQEAGLAGGPAAQGS